MDNIIRKCAIEYFDAIDKWNKIELEYEMSAKTEIHTFLYERAKIDLQCATAKWKLCEMYSKTHNKK